MEDVVSQKIFKLNAGTHQMNAKSAIYSNMNVWAMLPFSAGLLKNHPQAQRRKHRKDCESTLLGKVRLYWKRCFSEINALSKEKIYF